MVDKFKRILSIAKKDVLKLEQAEKSYGTSWRKRGGVGAFMMLKVLKNSLKSLIKGLK